MSAPALSASATIALRSAAVLLRHTHGFIFLPLLAESERAASLGLDFLRSELASHLHTVAWPLDQTLPLEQQRVQMLAHLDNAIGKLPPDTTVVLDATGSLHHDLALSLMAYVNHRREPLKAGGLRLVLCWPVALKDELLAKAPDLWSVRAASPWVDEADMGARSKSPQQTIELPAARLGGLPVAGALMGKLHRWSQHRDLQKADLSPRDALGLARSQCGQAQWGVAAELVEAVIAEIDRPEGGSPDRKALVDAINLLSVVRSKSGDSPGALDAAQKAMVEAQQLATANAAAYEPDLAASLNNLANRLSETGDRAGALTAAKEAADIYKRLAKTNAAAYEPALAASLNNLASILSETGDRAGALTAAKEAVALYEKATMQTPGAFGSQLAIAKRVRDGLV